MVPMDLFRLIAWIFVLFWGVWDVNVQLERLNKDVFEKMKSAVMKQLRTSKGFYHIVAIVLYSPYVYPVKSTAIWLSVFILLLAIYGVL